MKPTFEMMRFCTLAALMLAALLPGAVAAQSFDAGIRLYESHKLEDAKALFAPYADQNAEAAYYMGRIAVTENDPKPAHWFETAVKLEPRSSLYWDWLGRAYGDEASHSSRFKLPFFARKVKGAFDQAVALDPGNIDAREDLIQYFLRAPGFVGGSKEKAHEAAEEIRGRNAYRGGLDVSMVCAEEEDYDCAERELAAIVAAYPDSSSGIASGHFHLGTAYAKHGKKEPARAEFESALQLDPKLERARKALDALAR